MCRSFLLPVPVWISRFPRISIPFLKLQKVNRFQRNKVTHEIEWVLLRWGEWIKRTTSDRCGGLNAWWRWLRSNRLSREPISKERSDAWNRVSHLCRWRGEIGTWRWSNEMRQRQSREPISKEQSDAWNRVSHLLRWGEWIKRTTSDRCGGLNAWWR